MLLASATENNADGLASGIQGHVEPAQSETTRSDGSHALFCCLGGVHVVQWIPSDNTPIVTVAAPIPVTAWSTPSPPGRS
jgi:hypothetical protein